MADTVASHVLLDSPTHYVVHLVGVSDATGEAAVIKADKSTLALATDGLEADALDIQMARWTIQGYSSIRLLWDHTTDDLAMALAGSGFEDFGAKVGNFGSLVGLKDPISAGGTGDILLTSVGAVLNATYDITLWLRKRAS